MRRKPSRLARTHGVGCKAVLHKAKAGEQVWFHRLGHASLSHSQGAGVGLGFAGVLGSPTVTCGSRKPLQRWSAQERRVPYSWRPPHVGRYRQEGNGVVWFGVECVAPLGVPSVVSGSGGRRGQQGAKYLNRGIRQGSVELGESGPKHVKNEMHVDPAWLWPLAIPLEDGCSHGVHRGLP